MEIGITNREFVDLYNALVEFDQTDIEVSIGVQVDIVTYRKTIYPAISAIQEVCGDCSEKFIEYQDKLKAIGKKYAVKDENGHAIMRKIPGGVSYDIDEKNRNIVEHEKAELQKEYAQAIAAENRRNERFEKYLDEIHPREVIRIPESEFQGTAKDPLSKSVITRLLPIIVRNEP